MEAITVSAKIDAPLARVWTCWTEPEHIKGWNFASPEWHCPAAVNQLEAGGAFAYTMAARDGSMSFVFEGHFSEVIPERSIASVLADGRKTLVSFEEGDGHTIVTEVFDPENMNPPDLQRAGWQSILDNFKKYAETMPAE
jgi:uncharacterized protein YndB with AHSA1/START domain